MISLFISDPSTSDKKLLTNIFFGEISPVQGGNISVEKEIEIVAFEQDALGGIKEAREIRFYTDYSRFMKVSYGVEVNQDYRNGYASSWQPLDHFSGSYKDNAILLSRDSGVDGQLSSDGVMKAGEKARIKFRVKIPIRSDINKVLEEFKIYFIYE